MKAIFHEHLDQKCGHSLYTGTHLYTAKYGTWPFELFRKDQGYLSLTWTSDREMLKALNLPNRIN